MPGVIQDPKNAVFHDFTRWETKSQLNGDELQSIKSRTAPRRIAGMLSPFGEIRRTRQTDVVESYSAAWRWRKLKASSAFSNTCVSRPRRLSASSSFCLVMALVA